MKYLVVVALFLCSFANAETVLPQCEPLLQKLNEQIDKPRLRSDRVDDVQELVESVLYSTGPNRAAEIAEVKSFLDAVIDRIETHGKTVRQAFWEVKDQYSKYSIFSKIFGDGVKFRATNIVPAKQEIKVTERLQSRLHLLRKKVGEVEALGTADLRVLRVELLLRYARELDFGSSRTLTLAQGLMNEAGDLRLILKRIKALTEKHGDTYRYSSATVSFASFLFRSNRFTDENLAKLFSVFIPLKDEVGSDTAIVLAKALYLRGQTSPADVATILKLYASTAKRDLSSVNRGAITFLLTLKNAPDQVDDAARFYEKIYSVLGSTFTSIAAPWMYLTGESDPSRAKALEVEIDKYIHAGYVSYILTPPLLAMPGNAEVNLAHATALYNRFYAIDRIGSSEAASLVSQILFSELPKDALALELSGFALSEITADLSSSMADVSAAICSISADCGSVGGDCGGGGDGGACH